jgi:hypothetical protein
MNHWIIGLLHHRFIDASVKWIHWFIDSLIHLLTSSPFHWLIDSLNHSSMDLLNHRFNDSSVHWLQWFRDSLVLWFNDSLLLIHWFTESSIHSCVDSLTHRLINSHIHWFMDLLVHSVSCAWFLSWRISHHLLLRWCISQLQQFIASALRKLSYRPLISCSYFLFSKQPMLVRGFAFIVILLLFCNLDWHYQPNKVKWLPPITRWLILCTVLVSSWLSHQPDC